MSSNAVAPRAEKNCQPSLMLPKQHRLPGYLISHTLSSKNTLHSPLFSLKLLPTDKDCPCQAAFIVSTKISKLAVDRNRLKRQLKAAFYPHLKNLKPSHYLIFLAKHPLKQASFKSIQANMHSLLKKAKLISNEKTSSKNH